MNLQGCHHSSWLLSPTDASEGRTHHQGKLHDQEVFATAGTSDDRQQPWGKQGDLIQASTSLELHCLMT